MRRSTPCLIAPLAGAAILLIGCQSSGVLIMARAQRDDTCGARVLRTFKGRKVDDATRRIIERRTAGRPIRWIEPDQEILADLRTGRISILLTEDGAIKAIGCY